MISPSRLAILLPLFWLGFISTAPAQREGPPRRVSNPQNFELPAGSRVEFHEFHSPALQRSASYSLFLPPSYGRDSGRRFPVVYFLHGTFNDHTSWTVDRYGNLPLTLDRLMSEGAVSEFLMVHPAGENSFYTNFSDGSGNYEDMVTQDVIQEIEKRFRVLKDRRYRAIAGTSMGGYGALKIAMRNPHLFAAAVADSPIVLLGDDPSQIAVDESSRSAQFYRQLFVPIFGSPIDREKWAENSLEHLARSRELQNLKIYFAWGTADRYNSIFPMEAGVRTLSRILQERGIEHTFRIVENGAHGWELLQQHLQEAIRFLTQTF